MNRAADRKYSVRITTDIELSIATAAEWFAGLSDDDQAQFFIEVGKITETWTGNMGADWQFYQIGSHLKNCACSTEAARNIIDAMYRGLQTGTH